MAVLLPFPRQATNVFADGPGITAGPMSSASSETVTWPTPRQIEFVRCSLSLTTQGGYYQFNWNDGTSGFSTGSVRVQGISQLDIPINGLLKSASFMVNIPWTTNTITLYNARFYGPDGASTDPPILEFDGAGVDDPDQTPFAATALALLGRAFTEGLDTGFAPAYPTYAIAGGYHVLEAPNVSVAPKEGLASDRRGYVPRNQGWSYQTECDSCAIHFAFKMEATGEHTRIEAQFSGAEDMRVSFIVGAAPSGYIIMSAPRLRVVFSATGYGYKTMAWVKLKFSMTADGYRKVFAANRYGSVHPWPGYWSGWPYPTWYPWIPPPGWFPHGSMFLKMVATGRIASHAGHAPELKIVVTKVPYWAPELPPGVDVPNPTPDIDPETGGPVIDPETGLPKDPTNGYGGFGVRVRVGTMHTTWFATAHTKIKLTATVGEPDHTPAGHVEFRLRINFRYPMPIGEVTDLGEAHAAMTMLMFGNWYPIGGSHSQITFGTVSAAKHTAIGNCTFGCHVRFINYTGKHFTIGYLKPMNIWLSSLAGKLQPSNFGDVPAMSMSFGHRVKDGWVIPVRPLNAITIKHGVHARISMRHLSTTVRPEMETTP